MFVPITAQLLNAPKTSDDKDFLRFLREEADCVAAGGDANGEVCEKEAAACIKNAQEELNDFVETNGKKMGWNYGNGESNVFRLSPAKVDETMTQQEVADYFKMKAAKYSYDFQVMMKWVRPSVVNGVVVAANPSGLEELNALYKKFNDYIIIGESLSNGLDNRQLRNSA